MEADPHHAGTHLSKSSAAAKGSEEVIIARGGRLAVEAPQRSRKTMLGAGIGKIWMAEDFDSPATTLEIQRLFEGSEDDLVCGACEPFSQR